MNLKKIVITGGPSTGKTSVINKLEKEGHYCVHEVIRKMTADKIQEEGKVLFTTNPILSVSDPLKFNHDLLKKRTEQYKAVTDTLNELIFFDRGIPDIIGYMQCFGQTFGSEFENAGKTFRYDQVFHMPPWREIHVMDAQRFENYEESLRIDTCLLAAYKNLDYIPIKVPKKSIEDRVDFILDHIRR